MTKKESEQKRSMARTLYMSGMAMETIAENTGVSRATISRWCADGGWANARAAQNITRPELVNKLLRAINDLIDNVNASGNPESIAGLGDKLAKLSAVIEKLDRKTHIVDTVEVFMAFSRWLEFRSQQKDSDVTPELFKQINRLQDAYISEMAAKS